jgi:MFS transporter, ACS family, tartrate transporter
MMLTLGWSSDRLRERHLHMAGAIVLAALSVATLAWSSSAPMTIAAYLCFAVITTNIGMLGFMLVGDGLHPAHRVVGFAAMNSLAQVGSFLGPSLWGMAADRTGSFTFGLSVIPCVLLAAAGIVLAMRRRSAVWHTDRKERTDP